MQMKLKVFGKVHRFLLVSSFHVRSQQTFQRWQRFGLDRSDVSRKVPRHFSSQNK